MSRFKSAWLIALTVIASALGCTKELPAPTAADEPRQASPTKPAPVSEIVDRLRQSIVVVRAMPGDKPGAGRIGLGLIIDRGGIVILPSRLVDRAKTVKVTLPNGRGARIKTTKVDAKAGIAMLEIEGVDALVAAKVGNSDKVEQGDWVIALDRLFELDRDESFDVTRGAVSYRGAVDGAERIGYDSARSNPVPGDLLFDLSGNWIGIGAGSSTAIPSNIVKAAVEKWRKE